GVRLRWRSTDMDWGLAIKNFVGPTETPDVSAILRYAERAEALGFESLWAWDHVILGVEPSFPILDAVGILTAIAARTTRIKLGTGILVLPLRNPTVAAKTLGTLDVISGGRLILGAAAGWYAREFDAVGVPFKQRGPLLGEDPGTLQPPGAEDPRTGKAARAHPPRGGPPPAPLPPPAPADPRRRLRRRGVAPGGDEGRRLAHVLLHAGELPPLVAE